MMEHISRSWGKDAFAPQCGCTLLPCGMVEAAEANRLGCDQHSWDAGKTLRGHHDIADCPAIKWTDTENGVTQKGVMVIARIASLDGMKVDVTAKFYTRLKPGAFVHHDPQAMTLREFGHDD